MNFTPAISFYSIYWLVITGTTVGFGDIYPTRIATRIFSCIFFPLLVAVLGEMLARIASVYMERLEQQNEKEFLSRTLTMDDITKMDANKSGEVDKAGELCVSIFFCSEHSNPVAVDRSVKIL